MNDPGQVGKDGEAGTTHFGSRDVPAEAKAGLVSAHFTAVAERYDATNTIMSLGAHRLWKRKALQMAGLQRGWRVIDVCGGTGDLTLPALRAVGPEGRVVLYDFNAAMMGVARRKASCCDGASGRMLAVRGDAQDIAFADESFDAATVGFGIRNLTEPVRGLQEILRVLKPGARLVCLEFSRPPAAWFRCLYDLYSCTVVQAVGRYLTGSPATFAYLPESIRRFPDQEAFSALLREVGYTRARYENLTGGIAAIHMGEKGPRPA